ncbi:MarR family winged helix-turn-helix transcriptional regulator [Pelagibacterium sp.]|uniref:MarR family winged helix-turn-helix transcriptional regulator n=1 Tax=Pelagibacterium sp. TaxID=1967288 RepID=UPI003A957C86
MNDDFSTCLLLNARMAARTLTRLADGKLRPYGITGAQFNILASLLVHADRSVTELATRLAMERSTLSRNLDLLEKKGLVSERVSARANFRACRLTEAGLALIEKLRPEWRQFQTELKASLDAPDFETSLTALRQLAQVQ